MSDHKHEDCEFCRRFAAYREALEHSRVAGRTRRSNVHDRSWDPTMGETPTRAEVWLGDAPNRTSIRGLGRA